MPAREASLAAARTRLERGDRRTAARMLLALGGPEAEALLNRMHPDNPHGAVLAERLRFGPPETWMGWLRGIGRVVVKLYPQEIKPTDPESRCRFRHPGVAPLLAWGNGWTLHGWVEGERPSRLGSADLDAIARTLAALHAAGLAHGDLTPANIVLGNDGPVLIDWGETVAGTPGWRPDTPHDATERDLFALKKLRNYFLPAGSQ